MYPTTKNFIANGFAGNFFLCLVCFFVLGVGSATAQNVTLVWTAAANHAQTGYRIFYGTSSRGYTNFLAVGNVTNAVIPGLVTGKTYYFAVTTYDAAGNQSAFSAETSFVVPAPVRSNVSIRESGNSSPLASSLQPGRSNVPRVARPATVPGANGTSGAPSAVAANLQPATVANKISTAPASNRGDIASSAKAKAVHPIIAIKPKPTNPAPVQPAKSSPVQPAQLYLVADQKTPSAAEVKAAAEVVVRAKLFYAAVSVFDINGDGRLDDREQAVLAAALMNQVPVTFVSDGTIRISEVPGVTVWTAALYAQIAPLNENLDGELQPSEEAALAAALLANTVALPIFAPLMLQNGRQPNQNLF